MNSIQPAVCLGCTLLCDDVEFKVQRREITPLTHCVRSHRWAENVNRHLAATANANADGDAGAAARNRFSTSIAEGLMNADAPLVVGLNHLTTQAQQWAWRAADLAGASIDVTLAGDNTAEIYSLQLYGKVTSTLGEVASRSDLMIFWFCDPQTTHPRLIERLTQTPTASHKQIVVVEAAGAESTATAAWADVVVRIEEHEADDFIRQVRTFSKNPASLGSFDRGEFLTDSSPNPSQPGGDARWLAAAIKGCRYGSWIHGRTQIPAQWDQVTMALQRMIREFNDHTRFISLALRNDQNAISGENVLAAFSGFPAAVNLGAPEPRHNGAEFSAQSILEKGECDFVLLVAGWGSNEELEALPPAARAFLDSVPKIVVTSDAGFDLNAHDRLVISRPGADDGGEWCRLDDVSMGVTELGPLNGSAGGRGVSGASLFEAVYHRIVDAAPRAAPRGG